MLNKALEACMMCVDYSKLAETLRVLEASGAVKYLHMDVMDGEFVPNYDCGTTFIKQLRGLTKIPLDVHLMINRPDLKLDWFDFRPGEIVSVHYESTPHIARALQSIRQKGCRPFLALCPGTPVQVTENLIPLIDGVLVMTVNPGFVGQKMLETSPVRIRELRKLLDRNGGESVEIEVDGQVGHERLPVMAEAGANLFASGTSGIFHPGHTVEENIRLLQKVLSGGVRN